MYAQVEKPKENKSRAVANNRSKSSFFPKNHFNITQAVPRLGVSSLAQLMDKASGKNKWVCNNFGEIGYGKVTDKTKCKECGKKTLTNFKEGRLAFGKWWEEVLTLKQREVLLRANGSHEKHGGVKQKQ